MHREWEDNGILFLEGFYSKGKAKGLMKWFHEKGHLAGEGNMKDDVRFGPWKICDIQENGFCIDANFKDGKRDGIWKIYHENAQDKLWKEQTFKEDKMVSEKCWDKEGKQMECK
ncbi:MAG: toxin-antitoxin system YwqK family antitoxin [Saprospiraceae bacterium]